MGRRNKPLIVKHTDHRLDLGPAGHNLFISRDKQLAERSARRLRLGMRVVVALLVTLGALAALLAVWFYLVPFFHREFQVDGASSQESSLSQEEEEPALPVYDDMGLPVYGDEVNLFVINESQPAEADVVPQLEEAEGVQVDARIADAVTLLAAAAREDGLVLAFEEGYVSYREQERRFEEKVDQLMEEEGLTAVMARVEAKAQVPEAGESDFQTGMCLRVQATGDAESFEKSKTYSWLRSNLGKYGFIFRYPEGKDSVTGCAYDPTVIRYVGSAAAAAMQQRSMCLEEYLSYLESQ